MGFLKNENKQMPRKKLIPPILLVCEDSHGAVRYLEDRIEAAHLKCAKVKHFDINVVIKGGEGQHDYLVKQAIKALNISLKTLEEELPYDKIYCVMDYDIVAKDIEKSKNAVIAADNLIKAQNKKLKTGKMLTRLQMIVSNDCFELWYLLHFWKKEDISLPISPLFRPNIDIEGRKIGRELWGKLGDSTKPYSKDRYEALVKSKESGIYELIKQKGGSEKQAIINAKKLEKLHRENHHETTSFLPFLHNPSTEVHLLIRKIENMSKKMR